MADVKHVLVTGATSGLGRTAVDFLRAKGWQVTAVGRQHTILQTLETQGVKTVRLDLSRATEQDWVASLPTVDSIWHCAALSSPWGAWETFYQQNVVVTQKLLQAAAHYQIPSFIHVSTPAIYFDFQHHYALEETYRAKHYANAYAHTKAMAERCVQDFSRVHPSVHTTILRPRAIVGSYDRVLLPRLLERVQASSGRIRLPRQGHTVLDITAAENVAHAMFLATLHQNRTSGEAFNITNQSPMSISELLHLLFAELKRPLSIQGLPYRAAHLMSAFCEKVATLRGVEPKFTRYSLGTLAYDMTLNTEKAVQVLGYAPMTNLSATIQQLANSVQGSVRDA